MPHTYTHTHMRIYFTTVQYALQVCFFRATKAPPWAHTHTHAHIFKLGRHQADPAHIRKRQNCMYCYAYLVRHQPSLYLVFTHETHTSRQAQRQTHTHTHQDKHKGRHTHTHTHTLFGTSPLSIL